MALAAKYDSLVAVVTGTTLGMRIADVPAVFFADRLVLKISFKVIRYIAAGLFAVLEVAALFGLQIG